MTTNKRRGSACSEGEPLRGTVLPDNHIPEVSEEDILRCDIWVSCESAFCFQHGCRNVMVKRAKRAQGGKKP